MSFVSQVVALSDCSPLAQGRVRSVYAFPGQPELLIKVNSDPDADPRHSLGKRLARRLFPDSVYRNTLKEVECELLAALKLGPRIAASPLARSLGVVHTDRGPGVVVERISSADGTLALPLLSLSKAGAITETVLGELNAFVQKLFALQIVARDLHSRNIVYGRRNGTDAFFLIDGYGERNVVPLRSLSRSLNNRSLNKRLAVIAEKNGLAWHSSRHEFSFPEGQQVA